MKKNNNNNEKLKFSQTNILENTNSGKQKHNNILNNNINNNNIHKYQLTSHKNKIKNKYKDMSHYQRIY